MAEILQKFESSPEQEVVSEPSEADWERLYAEVEELNKRLDTVKYPVGKKESSLPLSRINFHDLVNNLVTLPYRVAGRKRSESLKSADNYHSAVKYSALVKKYLDLVDNYPEFKQKEMSDNGVAFPEILNKYFGQDEEIKKDGYSGYREAYIEESAKILEEPSEQETN